MMPAIAHYLRTGFTGKDNSSLDIGRVLWAFAVAVHVFLQVHVIVWLHQAWDPLSAAGGVGTVLAAGAAGLGLKANTEPSPPPAPPQGGA